MLSRATATSRCYRPNLGFRRTAAPIRCIADSSDGVPNKFQPGTKVKVTQPIKVYHIPKNPQGVVLEGMVGEVERNVCYYNDKIISANFPYLVKITTNLGGKDVTFKAHLEDEEIEAVE